MIDEPRHDIHDEVSELSVPEPRFGRQTHTHHNYITQVSEETEGRVMKKLSQKFSRTESKNMLGALLRIDDFLMNPLNQGYSGSTPEMSRNEYRINQETNDADSHSNPHPEAGIFHNQTTRNSGPEDGHDSISNLQIRIKIKMYHVIIRFVLKSVPRHRITIERL